MRPGLLVALLLLITSLSTAAMLFLEPSPKTAVKRFTPNTSVEIKWGEGSEAGAPEPTQRK